MRRRASRISERRARALVMLGLGGFLLPTRTQTAVWILTREPALGELRRGATFCRRALWPQVGWVALGAVGAGVVAKRAAGAKAPAVEDVAADAETAPLAA